MSFTTSLTATYPTPSPTRTSPTPTSPAPHSLTGAPATHPTCNTDAARQAPQPVGSLAVVIPAHDEEQRIDRTLAAYRRVLDAPGVEFHVALDGCRDRTADVVSRHARADRRVVVHDYPRMGKGGVLMETFRRCRSDLIAFVDADCATPPAELARLAHDLEATTEGRDLDGIIASRRLPASVTPSHRARGRGITSAGFAWLVRRLFRLPYADTQCGAKVLRRDMVERVVPLMSSRDFLFDVDLLVTARRVGFAVGEVPTVWIDQSGSKLDARRDALRMLFGAARLWIHHRSLPVEHDPAVGTRRQRPLAPVSLAPRAIGRAHAA